VSCDRVESADGRGVNGAVGGRDFVAINQVIDFKANEVEKQVSQTVYFS
jgi:hypothetical protein